jgi:D-alanyl-D-alanine carboxypeptidase (penicillin-binding protein 5/6)
MSAFAWPAVGPATELETPARHALLLDHQSGMILLDKDSDTPMPPASMSKLMTVYMVFKALKSGRLKPEDKFQVSEKAWQMGGSKMFVEVNSEVSVHDLLLGVIVQSGNDACIVLAEGLAGSEAAFAEQMNEAAKGLGLTNSHFTNASGWPDPLHLMSARDLAILAERLIGEFPELYELFKLKEFTYNKIRQGNRNPLLYKNFGADGLKTGHTQDSGYGLVASALRDGRRITLVLNGLGSVNERSRESARLLEWGFRNFDNYQLFKAGETVTQGLTWLGASETVPLVIEAPLTVTLARAARKAMKVKVVYDGPIPAPIAKGAAVATLRIEAPDSPLIERPLLTGADVDRLGLAGRLWSALMHLLLGVTTAPAPTSS